jgi:WD40 repeat protein
MASTLDAGQPDHTVTISPDGRTLAVATQDGAASFPVIFVDTRTLRRTGPRINPGYKDSVPLTRFSPDGRLLALGSFAGPGLAVADVRTGRIRWANRSISQVLTIGFSPDGRYLAAGTGTGAIETFGAASGRRLANPTMTEAPILAASYALDGRTILTSGMDGTVRLWDASSLRPIGKPIPAADDIWVFAAFSPDGSRIIALDITGRVLTWPATAQAWLDHACAIVGRDFTPQERALYSITPVSARPCP